MTILNVKENNLDFFIIEGDIFEVATNDGIGYYPLSFVAFSFNNETYYHPNHFLAKTTDHYDEETGDTVTILSTSKDLCNKFIEKIKSLNTIDLNRWNKATKYI